MKQTDTPLISGDDYNVILEDTSLQEFARDSEEDASDLTEASQEVLDSTMDIMDSTADIEAASDAGLLSAINLKAYTARVNSYMDGLESKFIITKSDRLMSGMQFDNPQAGLLSVKDVLKAVIRKVIEWFTTAINYYFNWAEMVSEKITQFIMARAGISKKLRAKLDTIKNAEYLYVDTEVYLAILKKRAIEFDYAIRGKVKDFKIDDNLKAKISTYVLFEDMDIFKMLDTYETIIEDKIKSRIPVLTEDGEDVIVRDLDSPNKIEQMLINDRFSDLSAIFSVFKASEVNDNSDERLYADISELEHANFRTTDAVTPLAKNTRAIIDVEKIKILAYGEKGLGLFATADLGVAFNDNVVAKMYFKIDPSKKTSVMIDQLNYLVKVIDNASASLKTMAKDSKERASSVKAWGQKNLKLLQKMAEEDRSYKNQVELDMTKNKDGIFNNDLKNRVAMNVYMLNTYPSIVSAMIASLSHAIDDGIRLIEASMIINPEKSERSRTNSNEDGRFLLMAPEARKEEILDAEIL